MPQFLIEVPHSVEPTACAREVKVFLATGSHFLSHAYWGCMDGVHCAWLVLEATNREEALLVVPPLFRSQAKVIGLNKFNLEQIEAMVGKHQS